MRSRTSKRTVFLYSLSFLCVCSAFAHADNVSKTPGAELREEDAKLNSVYKDLLALCNETSRPLLIEAEREWIKYRDRYEAYSAAAAVDKEGAAQARNDVAVDLTVEQWTFLEGLKTSVRHAKKPVEVPEHLEDLSQVPKSSLMDFLGSEGVADPRLLHELEKSWASFRDKIDKFGNACGVAGLGRSLSENSFPTSGQFVPRLLPIVRPSDCEILTKPGNPDGRGGYTLLLKGSGATLDFNEEDPASPVMGVPDLRWLIPQQLLLISIGCSYSGTGAHQDVTDYVYLIRDGKVEKLFEHTQVLFNRCGQPWYSFWERECRWDKASQTLILATSSTQAFECEPEDFQIEEGEHDLSAAGMGHYQKLKILQKKYLRFRDDKLEPEKNVYAIFLGASKVPLKDLANFLVLYRKSGEEAVRGEASPKEVKKQLDELRRANPTLANKAEWSGIVLLPSALPLKPCS